MRITYSCILYILAGLQPARNKWQILFSFRLCFRFVIGSYTMRYRAIRSKSSSTVLFLNRRETWICQTSQTNFVTSNSIKAELISIYKVYYTNTSLTITVRCYNVVDTSKLFMICATKESTKILGRVTSIIIINLWMNRVNRVNSYLMSHSWDSIKLNGAWQLWWNSLFYGSIKWIISLHSTHFHTWWKMEKDHFHFIFN